MQIRRSEKCVWQNRTAEREENDLGLQDDRMSGNIQDIARLITRLLLKEICRSIHFLQQRQIIQRQTSF